MAKSRKPSRPPHARERPTPRATSPRPRPRGLAESADSRSELETQIPTVVGVGASAGGLEAFSELLGALPNDCRFALVLVQHLSAEHESALVELLSARSGLPVLQATENQTIEPGHVYVIPPNTQITVEAGQLHLQERPADRSQVAPIDHFFASLARWAGSRAIGVVLSGNASDGAGGVRDIKEAGGITIAQRPSTAPHDSMPTAAIATGMVDLVLSPAEIAAHLAELQKHPYLELRRMSEVPADVPSAAQLAEVFTRLRRVSGIDFTHYKAPTVRRRLLRRMALHRVTDVPSYISMLREQPQEVTALSQDLLIQVTRFFREPESFEALAQGVLSQLTAGRAENLPLRVWVPGCATGEEVYSLGMLLLEAVGAHGSPQTLQLFGTDVSESAIERARRGWYPLSIGVDVSPDRLRRFFTRADGGYRVNKSLRDTCTFARHDLTRDPPFSRLDLIVCRNVLIYLDATLQKRLMPVFHYALRTPGYLMLGPTETTTGHHPLFTIADKRWRIYRKAPVEAGLPTGLATDRESSMLPRTLPLGESRRPEPRSVQDEVNRLLLQRFSPPGVIVGPGNEIVEFRGPTGNFLEAPEGDPSLNILKMAREGLLFPLRAVLQLARRRQRPVRKEGVQIRRSGTWSVVDIEAIPLSDEADHQLLVLFQEQSDSVVVRPKMQQKQRRASARQDSDERVAGLARELAASREYLESIIQELEAANEELQSANEEILSSNEELQSTNEELDTAKEELQSTNAELNTLNEELHARNQELGRTNSDLMNLLPALDIVILIIGDDLRIRRFTPLAERLLNLIPGDVGRPLGQINTNLQGEDLEALTRTTINTLASQEREVTDRQGRWYSLRIRPYKNIDNRIDGAVLTFTDMTDSKHQQEQVERLTHHLLAAVAIMGEPAFVLDEAFRVKVANRALVERLSLSADPAGVALDDLAPERWDPSALREALGAAGTAEQISTRPIDIGDMQGKSRVILQAQRFAVGPTKPWLLVVAREAAHGA
ncbi:MAG: chemotaxis protein CheB [Vicinamibacterales bacterium]